MQIEEFFENYTSNTLAACGNQTTFDNAVIGEGIAFIRVQNGGTYNYVFAFSGILDSTFGDGSKTKCNEIYDGWTIESLEYAVTDNCEPDEAEKKSFTSLSFDGNGSLTVEKEKLYLTDKKKITAEKGQFICLKIKFSGKIIPCHYESIIALYRKSDGVWQKSPLLPVPLITAVDRPAKKRIGFIGDSITQGIGSDWNSYRHYAAVAAEILGDEYAYWDLGLGYARGADMASKGVWFERAKQNDIVCICYGVNDMFQGRTVEQLKTDLGTIIDELKSAGAKVIIQSISPFDYGEEHEKMWRDVNAYVESELAPKADAYFNNLPILCADGRSSPKAKYGGHPNNEGHRLWGEALAPVIKKLIEK